MQIKFKPKFWRDIQKVKNDRQVMSGLNKIFMNAEKASSIEEIQAVKQLLRFKSRYRIKLTLDKKRNFRIGIYVHGKTVWFARFLHRDKIYDENW